MRVPIYVRWSEFAAWHEQGTERPLIQFLHLSYQQRCNTPDLEHLFTEELAKGNCLVLLDDFDMGATDVMSQARTAIIEFVRTYTDKGNHIILTSRNDVTNPAEFSEDYSKYTIAELNEADIAAFIKDWCDAVARAEGQVGSDKLGQSEAESMILALKRSASIRRLATSPLLLSLIALMHHRGIVIPAQRAQYYLLLINLLISGWLADEDANNKTAITEDEVEQLLVPLAYHAHANRSDAGISEDEALHFLMQIITVLQVDGVNELRAREAAINFLSRICEVGIMAERRHGWYDFFLPTMREYLAGRYMMREPEHSIERLREHLQDPYWEEACLLALGSYNIDHPTQAAKILSELCLDESRKKLGYEDIFHRDLLFAIRVCGEGIELSPEIRKMVLERSTALYFMLDARNPYWMRSWCEERARQIAVSWGRAAGTTMGKEITNELTARLDDSIVDESESRYSTARREQTAKHKLAVDALRHFALTDTKVVAKLRDTLFRWDESGVQIGAAHALSEVATTNTDIADTMLRMLRYSADYKGMETEIIPALEKAIAAGDDGVISILINKIGRIEENVVQAILLALGASESMQEEVIYFLTQQFWDERWQEFNDPGYGLRRIAFGRPDVAAHLLQGLPTAVGSYKATQMLRALAYTGRGNPDMLNFLLSALVDQASPLPKPQVIRALGEIGKGNHRVLHTVLPFLPLHHLPKGGASGYGEVEMESTVAKTIGEIGIKEEAVSALLINLQNNQGDENMFVLKALIRLDATEAVAIAMSMLEYDKDHSYAGKVAIATLAYLANQDEDARVAVVKQAFFGDWKDFRRNNVRPSALIALSYWLDHDENTLANLRIVVEQTGEELREAAYKTLYILTTPHSRS